MFGEIGVLLLLPWIVSAGVRVLSVMMGLSCSCLGGEVDDVMSMLRVSGALATLLVCGGLFIGVELLG